MMLAEAARPARQSLPFIELSTTTWEGGGSVHGGHQALLDAELLVDRLDDRGEAVGGARGARDDSHGLRVVLLGVDTNDDGRGLGVLGRGRDDDLLRAALDVLHAALGGGE